MHWQGRIKPAALLFLEVGHNCHTPAQARSGSSSRCALEVISPRFSSK
jgi:hypothetical protein